jgi:hypothetical protein
VEDVVKATHPTMSMALTPAGPVACDVAEKVDDGERLRTDQTHANAMGLLPLEGHRKASAQLFGKSQRFFELIGWMAQWKAGGLRPQSWNE